MKVVRQINTESEVAVGAWPDRLNAERVDQDHLTAELGREAALQVASGILLALADYPGEGVWIKISNDERDRV